MDARRFLRLEWLTATTPKERARSSGASCSVGTRAEQEARGKASTRHIPAVFEGSLPRPLPQLHWGPHLKVERVLPAGCGFETG